MTNKEIEYFIRKKFAEKTPDIYDRIKCSISSEESETKKRIFDRESLQMVGRRAYRFAAVAASVALVVMSSVVISSSLADKETLTDISYLETEKEKNEQTRDSMPEIAFDENGSEKITK